MIIAKSNSKGDETPEVDTTRNKIITQKPFKNKRLHPIENSWFPGPSPVS